MGEEKQPEPWLRGTLTEVPAVIRGVLHALELADEDLQKWCSDLTESEIHARPNGLASVGFQLRHIARSMDRLITYAEGNQLSPEQLAQLKSELDPSGGKEEIFDELANAFANAKKRVSAFAGQDMETARHVGRKALPTSVGGLLVHVADHTQRHVGQAIVTAKLAKSSG